MSHFKYVESERKSRKSKKKHREYAIFPDGDETDCSSRTTFYDICRQSSTTTSVSEQSSTEDANGHISENTSNHYHEENHDDVFYKLNSLTAIERVNSECTLRTKTTTTTKISAIDITITSPEPLRSPTYIRPSCSTRIRDDIDPETSSDEFESRRRSLSKSKTANNIAEPQKKSSIIENNMKMLPSIDVIPPSPTLSVLSHRLMIKREKTGSLQRSGITLSPISPRTLTPMSSLSSSSTMSDTFSLTSGSEDGILNVRSRFFNRKNVLPPIIRSASEEKQQEEDESFLQASIRTGKKNKNAMKCRKPKSGCFEEYRTNSCCSESIFHTQKISSEVHRHNESLSSQFDIDSSKKDNLYRPMNTPSTKIVDHHYKENVVNKKERSSQNIKSQKQGHHTGKDANRTDNKQNTRKKSNVNGSPCKSLLTVKDHYNKNKNIPLDPRKSLKGNQKQERMRKRSLIRKRDLLIKAHRVESVCKSISDSSDCLSTKSDQKNRSESINSFKRYSKSVSDSSDCMSSRSEQTDSTYL